MADKYHSIHTGQAIDSAVTKALNPSTTFTSEDAGKLADAKAVGELVNAEKERAEATYLPYDGYSQLARVGEADVADNLTPYSSDSGTSQNTPFILQGTACANGEEQADTGSYCQLKEKKGNTVVVNQYAKAINSTNWIFEDNVTGTIADGVMSFTSTVSVYGVRNSIGTNFLPQHKYLAILTAKADTNASTLRLIYGSTGGASADVTVTTSFAQYARIATGLAGTNGYYFYIEAMTTNVQFDVKDVYLIDLTLWFGSNDAIPTHLLNHPEDFFRYYQGDLSYNVGTLTDCNGRYLKTTGRNVWDEQWESGSINPANGEKALDTNRIRSKDYISVIPNADYYLYAPMGISVYFYDTNKNFISYSGWSAGNTITIPSNAWFIMFAIGSSIAPITTYGNNITISLYYEGESGYDQYYPYEELANIDTGNEPLLAFDYKTPDGVVHKNTSEYTVSSTEDIRVDPISGQTTTRYYFFNIFSDAASLGNTPIQCISDRLVNVNYATDAVGFYISNQRVYFKTTAATTEQALAQIAGMKIQYIRADASKTTEQGTPFPENVAIDDFGTMAFDCPNGVPQGNTVFYPVDYKAEFDTLHNITEGDMHKIVLKGELAEGEPETIEEVVDYINAFFSDVTNKVSLGNMWNESTSRYKAVKTGKTVTITFYLVAKTPDSGTVTLFDLSSDISPVDSGTQYFGGILYAPLGGAAQQAYVRVHNVTGSIWRLQETQLSYQETDVIFGTITYVLV